MRRWLDYILERLGLSSPDTEQPVADVEIQTPPSCNLPEYEIYDALVYISCRGQLGPEESTQEAPLNDFDPTVCEQEQLTGPQHGDETPAYRIRPSPLESDRRPHL